MEVEFGALKDLQKYVDAFPNATLEAARIALNDVVGGPGLVAYRQGVQEQANFPPGYLNDDRLGIEKKATKVNLETTVIGRFRPTNLARFVQQGNAPGHYGVTVRVRKATKDVERGFLIRLRNGNQGLAVRLAEGERPKSAGARRLGKTGNTYLLYGPSVEQLLGESSDKRTPGVLTLIEREFFRQFFRLTK